jgi:hypothetical protein
MLGLAHTLIATERADLEFLALLHGMRHGARTCSGNRRHRQGHRVGGDSIVARWRPIADFFNSIGQIRLSGDVTSMSGLPESEPGWRSVKTPMSASLFCAPPTITLILGHETWSEHVTR